MATARSIQASRKAAICCRRSDTDVLAHAERLEAVDVGRGLAAEAVGGDVEGEAGRRHRAARGGQRVDRVAGGRRQHEVGGLEVRRPVLALVEPVDDAADVAFAAAEAAHRAEQVREALQVAVPLEVRAAHHRRKAQTSASAGR